MISYGKKLEYELLPLIKHIQNPIILELGVQRGNSTKKFLKLCQSNNGHLYSLDIDDCSNVTNNEKWTFIQSRDDNFEFVNSKIPSEINVIFIDTLHEAKHVEKLIYNYYEKLVVGGYIFIDDISHLPYLNNQNKNDFYCEINNKETFDKILEIYYYNQNNFNLNFSFYSSGLAVIKKLNNLKLNQNRKLNTLQFSFKNLIRKIWQKIKN